eukprot:4928911-Pyramimonas_sp.AAC.1
MPAKVGIPGWPGLTVYSAYMYTAVGLDAANMRILKVLGSSIFKAHGSILCGADWNLDAQAIEESGFTRKAGPIAVVPTRHTCIMLSTASTIDYFCVLMIWFAW